MRRLILAVATATILALLMPAASGAAGSYTVTMTAKSRTVTVGSKAVLTGTVSPKAVGQAVILQKRYSKTAPWTTERSAKIAADGSYRVTDQPTSNKTRWYRVVKPAAGGRGRGVSDAVKVTVYAWQFLTDLDEVGADNMWEDPVELGGTNYSRSLYFYRGASQPGYIEYNLARRCISLTGVFGLEDMSSTGSSGSITVSGDGAEKYYKEFGVGQYEKATVNTSGVFRIRFDMDYLTAEMSAVPVVGNPKVLCTR